MSYLQTQPVRSAHPTNYQIILATSYNFRQTKK